MGYYYHPIHGLHQGDPIGGAESTTLTESEFIQLTEERAAQESAQAAQAEADRIAATPIAVLAQAKLGEIRAARRAIEHGGVTLDDVRYESDPTARAKYVETNQLFLIQPTMEIPGWKASDDPVTGLGIYVTMTPAVMASLIVLAAQLDGQAFAWEAGKQAEVATALALEDEAAAKAALIAIQVSV